MIELEDRDYAHFFFNEYDLEAQLIAIRGFLARSNESEEAEGREIKQLARRAQEIGSDHLVGLYTDGVHASVYSGAAHSAAAVGMLAPFVENLFTGIFRGIGEEEDDYLGRERESKRSQATRKHFWDPHMYYAGGEVKTNLVGGIVQLAESTRLARRLPKDAKQVLEALFEYRNAVLHNGFEWPLKRREEFARRVEKWNSTWFISAQSGGKPWVWYMSDTFVSRVLEFIDEVIVAAGRHARETYHPSK